MKRPNSPNIDLPNRNLGLSNMDLPNLVTALPGPKAAAIIERDSRAVSPSYTRSYPLVVDRAHGAIVEDVDGNRFLDCNAGIAVVATGHCHPHVVDAIQRQAVRLIHMSGTDFYYENMVQLAEKLVALVPGGARDGGYRGCHQNGALSHRPGAVHRVFWRISWAYCWVAVAHSQ